MPRFIIAATCAALALSLGACGKDDEGQVGRDSDDDGATVATTTTPPKKTTPTKTTSTTSTTKTTTTSKTTTTPPKKTTPTKTTTTPKKKTQALISVGIKNIKFTPKMIIVNVGQKIVWTNNEAIVHNVTATKGADFESDSLKKGDRFEYTPTKAGNIDYVCTIHSGQDGTILVRNP